MVVFDSILYKVGTDTDLYSPTDSTEEHSFLTTNLTNLTNSANALESQTKNIRQIRQIRG